MADRAEVTGLLYNYLSYESPEDVDGNKRANVEIDSNGIKTSPASIKDMNSPYGKKPTLIANKVGPTSLVTRYSPKDPQFVKLENMSSTLLRSALRKIVDEV